MSPISKRRIVSLGLMAVTAVAMLTGPLASGASAATFFRTIDSQ
jgi:hypothetical protein